MCFLDTNFDLTLDDVNNNYVADGSFLNDSDGFLNDVDLTECEEGGRASTEASNTGVHENQAALGKTSGGGGRLLLEILGFKGMIPEGLLTRQGLEEEEGGLPVEMLEGLLARQGVEDEEGGLLLEMLQGLMTS